MYCIVLWGQVVHIYYDNDVTTLTLLNYHRTRIFARPIFCDLGCSKVTDCKYLLVAYPSDKTQKFSKQISCLIIIN